MRTEMAAASPVAANTTWSALMSDDADHNRSLAELERQSEAARSELVQTVDELRHRVPRGGIKGEAKEYVRRAGQTLLQDIGQRARDNPLQAVAIGAGLAYPAWRILRSIPVPVLLLGAGVALAGRGGSEEARTTAAPSTSATTEGGASRTASKVADAASSSYHGIASAGSSAAEQAAAAARRGQEQVIEAVERHPLLVGGISLLVGAAVAACLPQSRTEDDLLGETSDKAKDRVRDVTSRGVQAAKAAGQRVYESTLAEADQQGLTPEAAQDAARELGRKARTVAERTADDLASEAQGAAERPSGDRPSS